MASAKKSKDETNLEAVLAKIADMPEHVRPIGERLHQVIMAAAPDLRPRVWYGSAGYAKSGSSPVLIFFRHDEYLTLGLTEKANLKPAGGTDGQLMPCAWFFEELDDATEKRISEIVDQSIS